MFRNKKIDKVSLQTRSLLNTTAILQLKVPLIIQLLSRVALLKGRKVKGLLNEQFSLIGKYIVPVHELG